MLRFTVAFTVQHICRIGNYIYIRDWNQKRDIRDIGAKKTPSKKNIYIAQRQYQYYIGRALQVE